MRIGRNYQDYHDYFSKIETFFQEYTDHIGDNSNKMTLEGLAGLSESSTHWLM